MDVLDCAPQEPESISVARYRELLCDDGHDDGRRSSHRRASRRIAGAHSDRCRVAGRSRALAALTRRRTLPASSDGAKLPEMVGAVIYVRVSTKEQTENLSLPTQLRACEEYCRRHGYEILERFHEEGESAKTTDRTQLQALLKYCRTRKGKVHFVVVYNLKRFAREKYDHFALRAHLQSLGISLRSATEPIDDSSTGKLMEGVLAAFAQFDNDVRSDRTRAGMRTAPGTRTVSV
jgi:predicted site-specific integrase-resolvase